ncbi:MAG: hypothetical protein AMXMBFR82_07130 [Candidatus Hydrogenedentota bacterium]
MVRIGTAVGYITTCAGWLRAPSILGMAPLVVMGCYRSDVYHQEQSHRIEIEKAEGESQTIVGHEDFLSSREARTVVECIRNGNAPQSNCYAQLERRGVRTESILAILEQLEVEDFEKHASSLEALLALIEQSEDSVSISLSALEALSVRDIEIYECWVELCENSGNIETKFAALYQKYVYHQLREQQSEVARSALDLWIFCPKLVQEKNLGLRLQGSLESAGYILESDLLGRELDPQAVATYIKTELWRKKVPGKTSGSYEGDAIGFSTRLPQFSFLDSALHADFWPVMNSVCEASRAGDWQLVLEGIATCNSVLRHHLVEGQMSIHDLRVVRAAALVIYAAMDKLVLAHELGQSHNITPFALALEKSLCTQLICELAIRESELNLAANRGQALGSIEWLLDFARTEELPAITLEAYGFVVEKFPGTENALDAQCLRGELLEKEFGNHRSAVKDYWAVLERDLSPDKREYITFRLAKALLLGIRDPLAAQEVLVNYLEDHPNGAHAVGLMYLLALAEYETGLEPDAIERMRRIATGPDGQDENVRSAAENWISRLNGESGVSLHDTQAN